jgi:hypothetical protein
MLGKLSSVRILAAVIVAGALVCPKEAKAWDRDRGHDRGHHRNHGHHERVVYQRPHSGFEFVFSNGSVKVAYQKTRPDYVVVRPRVGVVVQTVPSFYQTSIINGSTYFVSEGAYYRREPRGYVVVDDPYSVRPTTVIVSNGSGEPFTVNVPNCHGGYNPVTMTRTGSGYIGPQGEYYYTFPTIQQLSVMYGK